MLCCKFHALHHRVVIGCKPLGTRSCVLHGKAFSLPTSEAPTENRHTLTCVRLLSVTVRACWPPVGGVLACEDHETEVPPLPHEIGKPRLKGDRVHSRDVHRALDKAGGPILVSKVDQNACATLELLVDSLRLEALNTCRSGHCARNLWCNVGGRGLWVLPVCLCVGLMLMRLQLLWLWVLLQSNILQLLLRLELILPQLWCLKRLTR